MSLFKGISYTTPLTMLHALCINEPWDEKTFHNILALPSTFGLGDDKGFILCSDLGDDVEILTLAVHPDFRRRGLASTLLRQLQQYALDNQKHNIFLEVKATNTPAIQLYKKMGFEQTGLRPNYYHEKQGTVDALCFAWTNSHNY